MVDTEEQVEVAEEIGERQETAILLELENLVIDGRQIVYDVLKSVLTDKGVKLTPGMFARHCVDLPLKRFLPLLLEYSQKKRVPADKLLVEIARGIKYSLTDGAVKLNAGAKKLMGSASDRSVIVGLLSVSDEETAKQVLGKLGLSEMESRLQACSCDEKGCPTADVWLKLAKKVSVSPSRCIAVVSSSFSCKAALSASMRCVAIPDKYTGFEDFGGADIVLEGMDESIVESIYQLME